jgi:hypothetical protein
MATLTLTIYDISKDAVITDKSDKLDVVSLLTDMQLVEIFGYKYTLVGLNMTKKMYQPTEIIADISIQTIEGKTWADISRSTIETMFKHRKVQLSSGDDTIGSDYYVHEVIPEYKSGCMSMRLKIYSLDKMLTLKKASRSFVCKQLSSILSTELAKYTLPYDSKTNPSYNKDNMHVLYYTNTDNKKVEHIFPYLVQYNESFYDMLARTTNRWGEFLYYEDGSLRIGYNGDESKIKSVSNYYKITYSNKNTDEELLSKVTDGNYEMEAAYDKTVYDTPVPKNPYVVRGELLKFGGLLDKYIMKKVASFLNTDKNITSWATNTLIDDSVSTIEAMASTLEWNLASNGTYFDDKGTAEQYGDYKFKLFSRPFGIDQELVKKGFNEFTEITSAYANEDEIYDAKRYGKIRSLEEDAANNVITINYDTTWPALKLGDIIKADGDRFIVFNISAVFDNSSLTFEVKGIGANQYTDSNKNTVYEFYPAVIPSGHVRYSGPQIATIKDADDPTLFHRVRLVFPWQGDASSVSESDASPWVPFAGKNDGKATTSRHYSGDEVFVGFIDGNIERPYVIGARQKNKPDDVTIDVNIDTPGGHHMRMSDGEGAGLAKFMASAFSPALSSFFELVPPALLGEVITPDWEWKGSKHFEGGFQISDYYGFYKISGSSGDRNITVSSPWGDVNINAFTGISISAPNGDIQIKGKNVKIEAGNNLELVSGTNIGWKLLNDKKYGNRSDASIGLTISSAIANKLAQKTQLLDLSLVRSIVEVVMRPVEGALTVRSNRFLKLEAGGNECEYPTLAYQDPNDTNVLKVAQKVSEVTTNKGVATDGIVGLFKLTKAMTEAIFAKWEKRNEKCLSKKAELEEAIKELKEYANDENAVCKTFDELKADLWNKGKETLSEDDLGFKENVKVEGEAAQIVDDDVLGHFMFKKKDDIISLRKKARTAVVNAANALNTACNALSNFEVTQDDVNKAIGYIRWSTLPKDAKEKMFNAINNQNCKGFKMFKSNDDEGIKSLTKKYGGLDKNVTKKFRRLICLNLLKEFHFVDERDGNVAEPTDENIATDETWRAYVNSIKEIPELSKEGSMVVQTFKDAFTQTYSDMVGDVRFIKAYREKNAWSDGKNGTILIGVGNNTFNVKGDGNDATFPKIETFNIVKDIDTKKKDKYLKKIKNTLLSI